MIELRVYNLRFVRPTRRIVVVVDAEVFRAVMGQWPSGVTVVTTTRDDEWHGMTASSFSSVSLEPPLVSVCIARNLHSHQLIEDSGAFAVNILSKEQVDLGMRFAGMLEDVDDRFAGLDCTTAETGSPLLPGTLGWVDCRVWAEHDGGDHTIFVGQVAAGGTRPDATPLLYHSRSWGQFADVLPNTAVLRDIETLSIASSADDLPDSGDVTIAARSSSEHVVSAAANTKGLTVRMLIEDAFGSPDQPANEADVVAHVKAAIDLDADVIVLSDSSGAADPLLMRRVLQAAGALIGRRTLALRIPAASGMGLANLLTALKSGVRDYEVSETGTFAIRTSEMTDFLDRMQVGYEIGTSA